MQVLSANSLTWLQSTSASPATSGQAGSSAGQTSPTADWGSDASASSSLLASLQSPSQMFSADSLNTLISAQTDPGSTAASSTGAIHHHHHHGGGGPPPAATRTATSPDAATAAAGSPASDSTDAANQMSELLMTM